MVTSSFQREQSVLPPGERTFSPALALARDVPVRGQAQLRDERPWSVLVGDLYHIISTQKMKEG